MPTSRNASYRLGLDLGSNSIGWAAIRLDDKGEPCGILDMGVRVFPDGRDAKSKESNAVTRRVARGARRRRDRYQKRRADLLRRLGERAAADPGAFQPGDGGALHAPGGHGRDADAPAPQPTGSSVREGQSPVALAPRSPSPKAFRQLLWVVLFVSSDRLRPRIDGRLVA